MNDENWIKAMELGERLGCHQMPERSFFYKGYQFPVCARCTGVILASIISIIIFIKKKLPVRLCIGMSAVMLTDWLVQYTGIQESNNNRRFITGMIGGFGYMTLHLHLYKFIFDKIKGSIAAGYDKTQGVQITK